MENQLKWNQIFQVDQRTLFAKKEKVYAFQNFQCLTFIFSGKCNHVINSNSGKHFPNKAFAKYKTEIFAMNGKLPDGFEHIM